MVGDDVAAEFERVVMAGVAGERRADAEEGRDESRGREGDVWAHGHFFFLLGATIARQAGER